MSDPFDEDDVPDEEEPDEEGELSLRAPCFNCHVEVSFADYQCYGCGAVVCERCDATVAYGSHAPEDHLESEDDDD